MTILKTAIISLATCASVMTLATSFAYSEDMDAALVHTGECQMLFVKENDMSGFCSNNLVHMIFDNGGVQFAAPIGDKGATVTFSGILKPDYSSEDQVQSVDRVILNLNIDGAPETSTEVAGECKYSNPYHGQSGIICNAVDADENEYHLRFRTDGEGPVAMPLIDENRLLPYGSRSGMNVTMTSASGIGTTKARIAIFHTRQNAKAFCLEYSQDISPQCVNETLSENEFPKAITANCRAGTFTAANGMAYQFRGRNKKHSYDVPEYRISELKSKKLLPNISASGYGVAVASLEKLCPNLL